MSRFNRVNYCIVAASERRDRRPALIRSPLPRSDEHRGGTPAAARPSGGRFAVSVRALAQDRAQLDIYGDIGAENGGIGAGEVLGSLRGLDAETLEVRINSKGGNAWDGLAIYNDLRSLPCAREVVITGVAGSAASIIAMAGDSIKMHDTAQFFIHQAWIDAAGNADFHEQIAGELRTTDSAMARIYAARTGIPESEIRVLMKAETLLSAQEAFDLGFCDEIIGIDSRPLASRPRAPRCWFLNNQVPSVNNQIPSERERAKSLTGRGQTSAATDAHLASGLHELATQIRSYKHA